MNLDSLPAELFHCTVLESCSVFYNKSEPYRPEAPKPSNLTPKPQPLNPRP